jgi:hypothetical protein
MPKQIDKHESDSAKLNQTLRGAVDEPRTSKT